MRAVSSNLIGGSSFGLGGIFFFSRSIAMSGLATFCSTFGGGLTSGLGSTFGSGFGSTFADGDSTSGSWLQSSTWTAAGRWDCQCSPKMRPARSARWTAADSAAGARPLGSSAWIA